MPTGQAGFALPVSNAAAFQVPTQWKLRKLNIPTRGQEPARATPNEKFVEQSTAQGSIMPGHWERGPEGLNPTSENPENLNHPRDPKPLNPPKPAVKKAPLEALRGVREVNPKPYLGRDNAC